MHCLFAVVHNNLICETEAWISEIWIEHCSGFPARVSKVKRSNWVYCWLNRRDILFVSSSIIELRLSELENKNNNDTNKPWLKHICNTSNGRLPNYTCKCTGNITTLSQCEAHVLKLRVIFYFYMATFVDILYLRKIAKCLKNLKFSLILKHI